MRDPFINLYPLEGPRHTLLPLEPLFRSALKELARDAEVWTYLLHDGSTEQGFDDWYASVERGHANRELVCYVVVDKQNNSSVGVTGFKNVSVRHSRVGFGSTWLPRTQWGTGTNIELRFVVLRHLFEALDVNRCEFRVHESNTRNLRALERMGMTREGVLREQWIDRNGRPVDLVVGSILLREWPEVKQALLKRLEDGTPPAGGAVA